MAKQSRRPGRTIVAFFLALGIVFGLVALGGTWKPGLGLDLQGGTRITLATEGGAVEDEALDQARQIIDQRVNGSGFSEAEVTTQAGQYVIVEVPGQSPDELIGVVSRQAQLRFRLTSQTAPGTASPQPQEPTPTEQPGSGVSAPASPTASPTGSPSGSASATPNNRPAPGFADSTESPTPTAGPTSSATASASPSGSASATPTGGASESGAPEPAAQSRIEEALAFQSTPDQRSQARFAAFTCPADGSAPPVQDNPDQPLITCDDQGQKFLLSKSIIEGTQLEDASAGIPQQDVSWVVTLDVDGPGADTLQQVSRALVGSSETFAITLDGQVISNATFQGVIPNGQAQISGGFVQETAEALATSLRYGALPIDFQDDPTVEEVGPSLAGDQLSAGLLAGAIGLGLVMVYCLLYYRGLGLVVLASLVVAAALTYGLVLLLSEAAGFTLTLPGIAGLIVGVGVTADSFIVFFERIRDEMRDGKSMRVAVEAGWVRARNTCLAADTVSLLAAVVLYFFATGVVKGFAFALGLSTLIDLVVFFWFTKPMVSWLGRFDFFNQGHKLSGLDAENLGVDRLPGLRRPRTAGAGGRA